MGLSIFVRSTLVCGDFGYIWSNSVREFDLKILGFTTELRVSTITAVTVAIPGQIRSIHLAAAPCFLAAAIKASTFSMETSD